MSIVETLVRSAPLRDGEVAMAAGSAALFVMTTRLVAGRRLHWPLQVATVWRRTSGAASPSPIRISTLTWCGEWIMSAQLLDRSPVDMGLDTRCLACEASRRTTERRAKANATPTSGQVDF